MDMYNTGNPEGSTAPKDLSDNAQVFDRISVGTDPWVLSRLAQKFWSLYGMNQEFNNAQAGRSEQFEAFLVSSGFSFIGDYGPGLNFTSRSQYTVRDGYAYRLAPSTTVPYTTTGNWALESGNFVLFSQDDVLRQDLAEPTSTVLVGGQPAEKLGKLAASLTVEPDGRLRAPQVVIGTEVLTGAARRDAVVVGRNVVGLTDCHAFADRTIMSGVTDAGTYGVFDATTKLQGSNNQGHIYAFQHRVDYQGTGALQQLAGLLTRPVHSGAGAVNESYGADIGRLEITGGGTVASQYGVRIRDQVGATANVGLFLDQVAGNSIYAPGGAPMYHKGRAGFGVVPSTAYAVQFSGSAVGARRGFIETTAANLQIGAEADGPVQIVSNSAVRLQIRAAGNGYSVVPGADNAQALGDASSRWSQVFAGTATISTSDAREKTEVRLLNDAELAAASELAREIGAYKFLAAVSEKKDAAREHIGMTVQRAIEVLTRHGLEPFNYSFICYDETEDGGVFSFRESGLYAFIAAGQEIRLQKLEAALT